MEPKNGKVYNLLAYAIECRTNLEQSTALGDVMLSYEWNEELTRTQDSLRELGYPVEDQ